MAVSRSDPADSALKGELIEILASERSSLSPAPTHLRSRLASLPDVRCVLFDVYGTLFVSASGDVGSAQTESKEAAFGRALERSGFVLRNGSAAREAQVRYFASIRRRHATERSIGNSSPEVDIAKVWEEVLEGLCRDELVADDGSPSASDTLPSPAAVLRTAVWYETLSNPVEPMPEAGSTLAALASSNVLLGIVSNAQFYTPLLFPAFFGKGLAGMGFREDLCSWSYQMGYAKPSIKLFDSVLRRLHESEGIEPQSVLYVGNDMLNDVWTANQVGCRTALFAGDEKSLRLRQDEPRCSDLKPDIVIQRFPELLPLLRLEPRDNEKGISG